ncbi:phage minor capsid protein [Saccharopolyspora taberi]|uniref:phage minor capsid protein n=1 Tax=Saccharopolyspora taberi TaxID=60895 RepID=UPI0031E34C04
MAADPDELDRIAATVAQLYREAETALAVLMSRYLRGDLDRDMPAPAWAERKLGAVRALRRSAQAILAALQADSSEAFRHAAADAFRAGWRSALDELPRRWFPRSGLSEQAQAAAEEMPGFAAMEALAASVHADVGARSRNVLRDVLDTYRAVITAATARILTGTQTRRQAAQSAWQRFVTRGITSFYDRAGRRWKLGSYAEMATRTVTQRAAVQGQTDRLRAAGVSLVYVSNAPQECGLCRPFEGRVLRIDDGPTGEVQVPHALTDEPVTVEIVDTLAGAQLRGLFHPNCRHSVSAYLPGVTKPPPQPTADPEGDKARQRQREIERTIRKYKLRAVVALDDDARKAANRRVREWQGILRDHLAEHPKLKRLRYREQPGAGNIATDSTRATGVVAAPADTTFEGVAVPTARRPLDDQPREDPQTVRATDDVDQLDLLDQPAEPLPDFTAMSDDELAEALGTYGDNDDAVEAILAELDRRQEAAEQAEQDAEARRQRDRERRESQRIAEQERQLAEYDRLVSEGMSEEDAWAEATGQSVEQQRREDAIARLRADGFTGRGFDELARAAYRKYIDEQYWQAEADTNGYLLSNAGEAAGVDPRELFTGPAARARKWASDELLEWWEEHGRITFDEFAAQLLGDTNAARDAGFRTGGEDWLR